MTRRVLERKIEGVFWTHHIWTSRRSKAKASAKRLRKQGLNARVFFQRGAMGQSGYGVFKRLRRR